MKKTVLAQVKEEIVFFLLMELKGDARCESRVPAGPSARESPEGFTHNLCKPLSGSQVGTHKYIHTHRTQWMECGVQVLHIHIHADSQ